MERPPKKYVCEKCGYLGDTPEHEGCNYLAWTTGEQLYIDQLERELALLKASPASAPEDVIDAVTIALRKAFQLWQTYWQQADSDYISQNKKSDDTYAKFLVLSEEISAVLAAAPTPPVSEGRKDAERFRDGWTHACNALCMEIALWIERCPHCGMPAPKAPTMQEDKL